MLPNRAIKQLGLKINTMNEVEDSHSSTVYRCTLHNGENIFLKIPYTKLKFRRELEAYEILKGRIAIPNLLDYWTGDEEYPGAFVLSELKGSPLTTNASETAAYQVGVLHATMHTVQPPEGKKLVGVQNEFPNWSNFIEEQFYSFAEDVKEVVEGSLYDQAVEKYEAMKRHIPSPDGPCFVHMDFRPANIIVEGDKVLGMIDFESVRFGSTEIDFTKLYRDFLQFNPTLFRAFKEGYRSIRPLIDLEVVLPFYLFTDAFNSIGWCRRRGIERNALFLENNLTRLRSLLGKSG
ncbi:phosphotransferase family protein [Ureibacillus sinduriensis]|uniref:Phosphotransferase n=1 Tax=Ureibacillus sinduriensis BLB-1 = JCM 15800 TaxID=1384057 RepID=A0A0A3I0V2_9BACL|nr:aminoglycoside phosphotransferase family protein [Ureibacillus sinduriensis]KGR76263.1 phosphotransferase [Ureibacillus sinduriensis BLB-1 = JCM 15800]